MQAHALRPRKAPRQARAEAMVGVILEAAARVLARESLAGFNTNRVAEVAGISVGSLYQYFPNKSAVIAALITREQDALCEAVERSVAASVGRPLAEALAAVIEVAIAHQFGNAVYAAALDHEERRLPIDAVLGAAQRRIVAAVHRLLARHRPELGRSLPANAGRDCMLVAKAMIEAEPAAAKPRLAALKRRVLRALLGYLQHEPAAPARRRVGRELSRRVPRARIEP